MNEDNFQVECSDEEVDKAFSVTPNGLEPCPSEIIRLYEAVAKDGSIPITWKWELGRRPPTPSQNDSESEKEEEEAKIDTSGFDFDEELSTVRITPRRTPGTSGLKGSAKKKTTNFENILASVRRRQKLEMSEKSGSRKDKK
ncbi:PAXIP1-associated glutamate-rich protein 1A isoform X2 [Macrobrachium rosenbergii]|uniref:PAXIP1-associated glutamate-rich protein 1A isoform X2 n=1 Tax=Macrobrachium rosenbergii TaxID=79674 RepID=UPI0034D5D77D